MVLVKTSGKSLSECRSAWSKRNQDDDTVFSNQTSIDISLKLVYGTDLCLKEIGNSLTAHVLRGKCLANFDDGYVGTDQVEKGRVEPFFVMKH